MFRLNLHFKIHELFSTIKLVSELFASVYRSMLTSTCLLIRHCCIFEHCPSCCRLSDISSVLLMPKRFLSYLTSLLPMFACFLCHLSFSFNLTRWLPMFKSLPTPAALFVSNLTSMLPMPKKVQVGNDQEKEQSERNSHSKNRGGEKTKLTIRHLY